MGIELGLAALAGGLAASAMAPKMPTPQIPEPTKPPQATKTPDRAAMVATNKGAAGPGGSSAGNSGTFLTGATGIDPSTLNLGKNVLLGE